MTRMNRTGGTRIPIVAHVEGLARTSDLWLADIWGVMHNGVAPFAGAVDACERFRAMGGTVLLLSNAPRPAASVASQLDRIGVSRAAFDAIVSSGDAARGLIADAVARHQLISHLGPERDTPIFDGLGHMGASIDVAGVVVCTGLFDDETETPDDYADLLADFKLCDVEMICANPDLTVERGGKVVYCAGAIAAAYEQIGGKVAYAGKPHLPIYDMALKKAAELRGGPVPRDRVLAIGDGIRTDIAGAAAAGVRSVFVASGIHIAAGASLDDAVLAELFPEGAAQPVAAMTGLRW